MAGQRADSGNEKVKPTGGRRGEEATDCRNLRRQPVQTIRGSLSVPGIPCPLSHKTPHSSPHLPSQSLPRWYVLSVPAQLHFPSWPCVLGLRAGHGPSQLSGQAPAFCKHLLNVHPMPEAAAGLESPQKDRHRFLPVFLRLLVTCTAALSKVQCEHRCCCVFCFFTEQCCISGDVSISLRCLHNNQGSQKYRESHWGRYTFSS